MGDQKSPDISRQVRGYLSETRIRMPPGISLSVWKDDAIGLSEMLEVMFRNAASGFCLVVLILALFLRLRLAVWVSLGIPISFMGVVALMPSLDISINATSLMGFIIVLGMVVDDAIVVGESVHTNQQRTGDRLRGAVAGVRTIVVPVVFGVFTTIAAFAPLLFLPGPMGSMGAIVPTIVIACLLFSLVESIFILPAHLCQGTGALDAPSSGSLSAGWRRFQGGIASGLSRLIDDLYGPALKRALEWRYLTLTIMVSLLCVTAGAVVGGWLKFTFMAPTEENSIVADLTMAQGTKAETTAAAVDRIVAGALAVSKRIDEERADGEPSVFTHVVASVGEQPDLSYDASPLGGRSRHSASNLGEVQIELIGFKERDLAADELANLWRGSVGEIPGAVALEFRSAAISIGAPIHIELRGDDFRELARAAADLRQRLASYPGIFDITDSFRAGKQELEVQILPSAEALGLTHRDLARQLRQGFYGEEAQSIQRGPDEVKVMIRYPAADRRSLADVERMRVRSQDGSEIPFRSVARANLTTGFSSISHVDGRRVVSVTAQLDQSVANANEILRDLQDGALADFSASHPGVRYALAGEQSDQAELVQGVVIGMLYALLFIYGLLAIPLRSYVQPLIIMSAIPFGFVGAAFGHAVMGAQLEMHSFVGLIALSGIVVNASLVLVHGVNRQISAGRSMAEAVDAAARERFRAILLTSLTTFGGLSPMMMMETEGAAQMMVPMAISVAFGLVFATAITLFLVPCSYLVLEDLKKLFPPLRVAAPAVAGSRQY